MTLREYSVRSNIPHAFVIVAYDIDNPSDVWGYTPESLHDNMTKDYAQVMFVHNNRDMHHMVRDLQLIRAAAKIMLQNRHHGTRRIAYKIVKLNSGKSPFIATNLMVRNGNPLLKIEPKEDLVHPDVLKEHLTLLKMIKAFPMWRQWHH